MEGLLFDHRGHPSVHRQSIKEAVRERAKVDPRFLAVLGNIERGWKYGSLGPRASGYSYEELLSPERVVCADGVQVLNTTAETIMCPDFTFAGDAIKRGNVFKYTLFFDISTVITTPGTITFRLRWGGVAGTALCTSGAIAPDPTAAATNVSGMIQYYIVVRSDGAAGSMFAMGRMDVADLDDATVTTLKNNLDMTMIPASAPAAVGSLDTTTSKALTPTVQFSVATATTQLTNHIALLESLS